MPHLLDPLPIEANGAVGANLVLCEEELVPTVLRDDLALTYNRCEQR